MTVEFILKDADDVRISEFNDYQRKGYMMIYDKHAKAAIFVRKLGGWHTGLFTGTTERSDRHYPFYPFGNTEIHRED